MRTTDKFFELIEATFTVDTITPEKIMDEFYSGSFTKVKAGKDRAGKQRYGKSKATRTGQSIFLGLADRLAEGREIYEQIDIEKDYDKLRELRNQAKGLDIYSKEVVNKAESKMKEISEEIEEISEERRIERIRTEKQEKRLSDIESQIPTASTGELGRLENRLDKLEIDTSEARGLINERLAEIEEEKEANIKRQEEAREEKEALRREGIEPALT